MVALVNEQVHEAFVGIDHYFDLLKMLLLQEIDLTSIILWKHANLSDALLSLTSSFEQDCICFGADLSLYNTFVYQLANKLQCLLFRHVESLGLIKSNRLESILILNDVNLQSSFLHFFENQFLQIAIFELIHALEDFDFT